MTEMKQDSVEGANYRLDEKNQWLSLPAELTTAIFLICHSIDPTALHPHEHTQPPETPPLPIELILSSVCSHWRVLALHLPALWKRFIFAPNNGVDIVHPPKKLDTYEKWSDGQLEDIYLNLFQEDYKPEGVEFISNIFRRHSQSLRRFALVGGDNFKVAAHLFNLFSDKSAPDLEYLALIAALTDDDPDMDENIDIDFKIAQLTSGAPKLKYLCCDGAVPGLGFPPIANLSTLRIEGEECLYVMPFDLLQTLLSLPLLVNLSLRMPDFVSWPGENNPTTPITMHRLKSLRLCAFEPLLPFIFAPALEFVTLRVMYFSSSPAKPASHSFPTVHDLNLISCNTNIPSHCLVYHTFPPSVKSLTVVGYTGVLCPVRFFAPSRWSSLRHLSVDEYCKPGLINMFGPTLTKLKVRVPFDMLPAWKKANESESFTSMEPLEEGTPIIPSHWPQDDLESQGFAVWDLDWFCIQGSPCFSSRLTIP